MEVWGRDDGQKHRQNEWPNWIKTQILILTPINSWFLTNKLKLYNEKKASARNGYDIAGYQQAKECK